MPAWLWPLVQTAIGVGGSLLAGRSGAKGQQSANRDNIALAREQMAFQERMAHSAQDFSNRMSSTAVQRSMDDYRAAGLNPALAYENTASAPTGVTAGGSQARVENVAASALTARRIAQEMQATATSMTNQTRLADSETRNKDASTKVSEAQARQIEQQTDFNRINQPHITRNLELQNLISQLGITGLENEQELEEKLKKLPGGSSKTLIAIIRGMIRPR